MFGYVKPLPGELLLKEYGLYKAVYCGLCRTGGKKVSRLTRLFLSYDFTALALLRLALTGENPVLIKARCPYSLKKRDALLCDGVFTYTSAAFACLSFCKQSDDVKDERGLKRLGSLMLFPIFKRMKRRADRLYPDLYSAVAAPLSELSKLEAESAVSGERVSLDALADGAAEAVAVIAAFGLEGKEAAIAREAGYHIGRFIYITDAADDLKKDAEKRRFNPLAAHYGSVENAVANMEEIDETLKASAVRLSAAVGLAESSVYTDILQNIACLGTDKTVETVYKKYGYRRKENQTL